MWDSALVTVTDIAATVSSNLSVNDFIDSTSFLIGAVCSSVIGFAVWYWIRYTTLARLMSDAMQKSQDGNFRRINTVVSQRTTRILLVVEAVPDDEQHMSVMQVAECFGVQRVWVIEPVYSRPGSRKKPRYLEEEAKQAMEWLDVRYFKTATECILALKKDRRELWVTDLSQSAESLDHVTLKIPDKLALLVTRDHDECSDELLAAADYRIFYTLHGCSPSLSLSTATSLILKRIFDACPEARFSIGETDKQVCWV